MHGAWDVVLGHSNLRDRRDFDTTEETHKVVAATASDKCVMHAVLDTTIVFKHMHATHLCIAWRGYGMQYWMLIPLFCAAFPI